MNDSDDPKHEGLEKHIQLNWNETQSSQATPLVSTASSSEKPKKTGAVKQFYRDLMDVLTEPKFFFTERYPELSLTYALVFGIIVNWLAAFFNWLTRLVNHETLMDGFNRMKEKLSELPIWKDLPDNFWAQGLAERSSPMPAWIAELSSIALSPFQSLIKFWIYGVILFVGGFLLIPKKPNSHQDAVTVRAWVKLICFASAPYLIASILGFLPLGMGSVIGFIYCVSLLIIGMTLRFQISGLRSIVILMVPGFITFVLLLTAILIIAALIFGLFAALLHS